MANEDITPNPTTPKNPEPRKVGKQPLRPITQLLISIAIIALFFGQRMAKDYAGAAVLVPYFLLALSAIYLLAQR